jgi:hypothetical protein
LRAFGDEQSQMSQPHQEKIDSSVSAPQDNSILDQETFSYVVVERSAICRRSCRKHARTPVGSTTVLVIDDMSSGPLRGSLAVQKESDEIVLDEDKEMIKPRSRFMALSNFNTRTAA